MAVAAEERSSQQAEEETTHWLGNFRKLVNGLETIPGVRVLGRYDFTQHQPEFVPVVSVLISSYCCCCLGMVKVV